MPTGEEFLRLILRSGLLEREPLDAALHTLPSDRHDDAEAMADHLVRFGKLTRFQAGKLLRGYANGLILGPYRLLAPVGKGGMGTVFLVRDQRNDQLLALKVLPPKLARQNDRLMARFRREMEISQRVRHPNLCCTYEVGEDRGVPYIAMEYIPGRTLSRLVNEDGPLPLTRAAGLLAEVAGGLEHAHQAGLIHRDLKPSNILVTPRDHAKVLDLGLALVLGEQGAEARVVGGQGYIVGTMDYISPEQTVDPSAVDHRSDLYSLGCTLYFALCGQRPFAGGTSREKVLRQRHEAPIPLGRRVPGLPAGFVALVDRLMAKDPARRPATAAQAEAELRAWAADERSHDGSDDTVLDEEAILGEGASDTSQWALPLVDLPEEAPPPRAVWPLWLVMLLGVALGLLLAACVVVTVALMAR